MVATRVEVLASLNDQKPGQTDIVVVQDQPPASSLAPEKQLFLLSAW